MSRVGKVVNTVSGILCSLDLPCGAKVTGVR